MQRIGLSSRSRAVIGPWPWASGFRCSKPERAGRRGRDDPHYVLIAAEYAGLVADGEPHRVAVIAQRHDLKATQVRVRIHKCRTRELLTWAGNGRPAGALTEKGRQALDEARAQQAKEQRARRRAVKETRG